MVSKKKTLGIGSTDLNDIKPITENQKEVFSSYEKVKIFFYMVLREQVKLLSHYITH